MRAAANFALRALGCLALLAQIAAAPTPEFVSTKQKIYFWHSMSGATERKLGKILDKFHASQSEVQIEAIYKGSYTDALNGLVAAYRGTHQPHITQIFEVGTKSMMESGAIIPVEDLFQKYKIPLDKKDFLGPVLGYYSNLDGKLMSMPFNSSTPIVYYNKDILNRLGIKKLPVTWDDMFAVSKEIHDKSGLCGLVFGWQSWTLVENYTAINDLGLATPENGFAGLDAQMNLLHPELVAHIGRVADAVKKKEFLFEGRRSDPPLMAFFARKCAFIMDSSSSIATMQGQTGYKWGTIQQPYDANKQPKNSLIGGASLWVMKGHPDQDYAAVAKFLKFLTRSDVQAMWAQSTGYIPITYSAYKKSVADGFYKTQPDQETAVKQLLRGKITTNSRGIRLGNFSQIREVIEESLEKIWEGSLTAQQGLAEANGRANQVLRRFEELRSARRD